MKDISEMTTDELRDMVNRVIPILTEGVEKNMRQLDRHIRKRETVMIHMVKDIMTDNMEFLILCMMVRIRDKYCEKK